MEKLIDFTCGILETYNVEVIMDAITADVQSKTAKHKAEAFFKRIGDLLPADQKKESAAINAELERLESGGDYWQAYHMAIPEGQELTLRRKK